MADAATEAVGKQDGRNPDQPNYPPNSWCGVTAYGEWAFGHPITTRPQGADPGKTPGEEWWSVSDCDHNTVTAEVVARKYHGQTLFAMTAAVFAVLVEGQNPSDVAKALGLPATPIGLTTLAAQDVTPIQPAS